MAGRKDGNTLGRSDEAGATLSDDAARLASFASGVAREEDRDMRRASGDGSRWSGDGVKREAAKPSARSRGGRDLNGDKASVEVVARRRDIASLTGASRAAKDTSGGAVRSAVEAVEEKTGLRPAAERGETTSAGTSTGSGAASLSDATLRRRTTLQKATYAAKRGVTERVNDELAAAVRGDRESTLYASSSENKALSFLSNAGDGRVAQLSRTVKRFRSGKARLSDFKADKEAAGTAARLMAADRERLRQARKDGASDEVKEKLKKRANRRLTDHIRSTMSAGGTVTGHGLGLRVASTVRALAKTTLSAISSAASAVSATAGPWLIPMAAAGLLFLCVFSGGWGSSTSKGNHGALTGVEAEVYDSLTGYGFSDTAIAGILGNMKAESGMDPTVDADDGYGTVSTGLMQMVGSERAGFMNWCAFKGYSWSTTAAQMEWTFSGEEGTSSYNDRWMSPDRVGDSYTSCPGYEDYFGSSWYRTGEEYKAASDVKLAAFSWMACYEGCATGQVSHLDNRLAYAQEYLEQIRQGGDDGNGDLRSEAVVAAKSLLGVPYRSDNWSMDSDFSSGVDCNGLCYYAWGKAGITIPMPSGHYTDAGQFQYIKDLGNWVNSESELLPGDLVFYSVDGGVSIYHVAMYIGDGQVIQSSSTTGVTIESLYWASGFCGGGSPLGATGTGTNGESSSGDGWDWWSGSNSSTNGSFGGGESYSTATEQQKRIVDACKSTPSPGAGLCATWVSQVYEAAGVPQHGGNGNEMLEGNETSTVWSEIKVGQIVSAEKTGSALGQTYGHVAIYIGDGQVMDNVGYIRTMSLEDWVSEYGRYGWVKYGWPYDE